MKIKLIGLLMLLSAGILHSQNHLSIDDAIRAGLESNFGIRLERKQVDIAENNNSIGNAGMLPKLGLTASQSNSVTDSRQVFLTGQVNDKSGATSNTLSGGIQLNWTIFDGMKMFVRRNQLQSLEDVADMQLLLTVENTISRIHQQYYTLVQRLNQQKVLGKTLALGNERLQLANDKLSFGSGSRLEVLQALVDLHSDSAAYLNLLDQINQSIIALNTLLGRPVSTVFAVDDHISLAGGLRLDSLEALMLRRNTQLRLGQKNEDLARLALQQIRSVMLPEVGLNLGYNALNQQSQSGFLAENRSLGFSYGVTATMNLFNGFNIRREQRNMQLQIESSRLRTDELKNELTAALHAAFRSYQFKNQLQVMENQNLLSASENLRIATERYTIGDLSGIEFREAQRNYLEAETRLLTVVLELKILETQLLQLAGSLANS